MPARTARPRRVLVVTSNPALVDAARSALGVDHELGVADDAHRALATVSSEPLAGLVADLALPERRALGLAGAFLRRQPTGHAVLVAGDPGELTLLGLSQRDPRVGVVFRPWDGRTLREALFPDTAPL